MTKEGLRKPNYWGSLTQASTVRIGNYLGEEAFTPMSSLLPMVHPNGLVLGGWDISGMNLAEAMERAQVSLLTVSCQSLSARTHSGLADSRQVPCLLVSEICFVRTAFESASQPLSG